MSKWTPALVGPFYIITFTSGAPRYRLHAGLFAILGLPSFSCMDHSQDWKSNDNPRQCGYSCCHLKSLASWDSVKQRLYRYFWVLCVLNLIRQLITIPVILHKKRFILVFNTTSVPSILHALKHIKKFKLHDFKNYAYQFTWGIKISFPLHCKIYTDNCLSTFIIYCIGIGIFPIVYVLGLYNQNCFHKSTT
jgi:hypothetical protein